MSCQRAWGVQARVHAVWQGTPKTWRHRAQCLSKLFSVTAAAGFFALRPLNIQYLNTASRVTGKMATKVKMGASCSSSVSSRSCSSGRQLHCGQQVHAAWPPATHQVLDPLQLSAQMQEAPAQPQCMASSLPRTRDPAGSSLLTSSSQPWCGASGLMEAIWPHNLSLCAVECMASIGSHW